VLILGLAAGSGRADEPAQQQGEEKPPPPIRTIYDVTDLVVQPVVEADSSGVVPPTELGGARPRSQGSGSGFRAQQPPAGSSLAERVDQLAKLIEESIDPASWRDNGGSDGWIRGYQTRLIVSASPENQAKVATLISDLRQSEGRSVRVRATWAALSEEELKSVLVTGGAAAAGRAGAERPARGPRLVDLAAVERLKGAVRFRAEINCLNAQRVNVMAGRARSVLTSLDAVVGTGAAALEPTIDLVLSGATLTVTPVLSGSGAAVTLDVRAVAGRWDKADAAPIRVPAAVASSQPAGVPPAPPALPGPATEVERLNMPVHVVATAVRVPVGVAALVGGITPADGGEEGQGSQAGQEGQGGRVVYLILEAFGEK
jgi:hypothetical protein